MKSIILFTTSFLVSVSAFSATWEKVENDKSVFSSLISGKELYASVYKMTSQNESENMIQSLKQLTSIVRSEWGLYSMPERVDVALTSKENKLSVLTEDSSRQEPEPVTLQTLEKLQKFITQNNQIVVYEGHDGNSFGDCANIIMHDKVTSQVALLSVCYSE